MGRPINKNKIGQGAGRISATRYRFAGESEVASSTTQAWIVNQRSNTKFTVSDGSTTEVLTLVNKANGALAEGEFKIDAVLDDSTTVQVTKLKNRTVQVEGGTSSVDTVIYAIGNEPDTGDATNAEAAASVDSQ